MSKLVESIFKTLAYFDAQDMPLTLLEIRNYLAFSEEVSLERLSKVIAEELANRVCEDQGFYYLVGRENLVNLRKQKYRISLQRLRKAKKYLFWLRHIPYVRAVGISGSLALTNSSKVSDIDLFIILAKNRIWLGRTFVTFFFQVLAQRRHGVYTEDRFCLNHYIEEGLVLDQDHNFYTAQLYTSFLPIFGGRYFANFYEKNAWIREYFPFAQSEIEVRFFSYRDSVIQGIFEKVLNRTALAWAMNHVSAWYQKSRIRPQDYVLVSDRELSFHPDSKGQRILAKFNERLRSL